MEIRKTKNNTKYRESFYCENGKKVHSPWYSRKSDAKKWKQNKESEKFNLSLYGEEASKIYLSIGFSDYSKIFLDERKVHLSPSTFDRYKSNIRIHLIPFFGNKLLKKIKRDRGNQLIKNLSQNHKPAGVNLIMQTMKCILNTAVKDGYLLKSPFRDIPKFKEERLDFNYWQLDSMLNFLDFHKEHSRYLLYLIPLYTGMRRGEIANLKWNDIDFKRNLIRISGTKDRFGERATKSKKIRFVPMHSLLHERLLKVFKSSPSSVYVVTNKKGNPVNPNHAYRDFKKDQKEAGIQNIIRFHDMRHTFASQFIMNGGGVFVLQKILGHSKVEETMRYAHLSQSFLQGATQFMGHGT